VEKFRWLRAALPEEPTECDQAAHDAELVVGIHQRVGSCVVRLFATGGDQFEIAPRPGQAAVGGEIVGPVAQLREGSAMLRRCSHPVLIADREVTEGQTSTS
jgi:hypothetical protein